MTSLSDETIKNLIKIVDLDMMVALAVISNYYTLGEIRALHESKGIRNKVEIIFDKYPVFNLKILKRLETEIGVFDSDQLLDIIMPQIMNGPFNEGIPDQCKNERISISLSHIVQSLSEMTFLGTEKYNRKMDVLSSFPVINMLKEYQADDECLWSNQYAPKVLLNSIFRKSILCMPRRYSVAGERENTEIDKKYYQLISILMNCYMSVTRLDQSEKKGDPKDTVDNTMILEDQIVQKIVNWLESNSTKAKSASKI